MKGCLAALVMGLAVVGCAVGIEDPQPPPTPEPEQRMPPSQTFAAELVDYSGEEVAQISLGDNVRNVPPKQKPPVPQGNQGLAEEPPR